MFAAVPCRVLAYQPLGQFAQRGITTGCDTNLPCPERGVTRAAMAAFIIRVPPEGAGREGRE